MDAADIAHGPRREGCLVVAEECAGAGKRNGEFVRRDQHAEISRDLSGRGCGLVNGEDPTQPVDHGDGHRIGLSGRGRGLHEHHDVVLRERLRPGWRRGRRRRCRSAPACGQSGAKGGDDSKGEQERGCGIAMVGKIHAIATIRTTAGHCSQSTLARGAARSTELARSVSSLACEMVNEFVKKACSSGSNRVR